jgi:radical SAM protein with 4Fe4S-binding SPASM domain
MSDPLSETECLRLLGHPRPKRRLPLAPARHIEAEWLDDALVTCTSDRPIYAIWELTLACDLACRHCGSRAGKPRDGELDIAEALALVAQLGDLGVREVTLIGGEVYLYEGWTQVIGDIRGRGMDCTMVTAGRALTKERALAALEAGLQSVSVSIDGNEQTHDRLRALTGAYSAALGALANCRAVGLPVGVNTQINRLTLPHLREVCDVLVAFDAHSWQVQLTVPAGRAADEPDVILQPFDLIECMPLLASLKDQCEQANIGLNVGNNIGYFGPYERALRGHGAFTHRGPCSAGKLTIGIESNGDIKGCPSLPSDDWVGGNIRQHALIDIWEKSKPVRYTRDQPERSLWGYCSGCYYASVCKGGCTWMATSLFGRPGNNPYCHHRVLELQRANQRERVRPVAPAPGHSFDHALWEIVVEELPSFDR